MSVSSKSVQDDETRAKRVRRFASGVSVVLMVFCNAIFLLVLWASGVNLDELVNTPDLFNPKQDVCLQLTWQRVNGTSGPVRICSEWINLADPSGKPHQLQQNTSIRRAADGHFYVDRSIQADYRLLALVFFVAAVIAIGVIAKWYLVSRYRLRLETAAGH